MQINFESRNQIWVFYQLHFNSYRMDISACYMLHNVNFDNKHMYSIKEIKHSRSKQLNNLDAL